MKILYYDCFSGISGDMNLSAMVDLGVPEPFLINELKKLNISNYELKIKNEIKRGISGKRIIIEIDQEKEKHHHRHLSDITSLIDQSDLNKNVKHRSIQMFNMLGEAEAKIHDKDINEIHFHEVGAVDSIIDIVGAAICFDYLNPDKILCSAVELGSGFVKCAHGTFPVPAPATAEILTRIPVRSGGQPFEATTPTGAVILACYVDEFAKINDLIIQKTGYGIGHKDSEKPNVLRLFWGELKEFDTGTPTHYMIECNIDDMNPELLEYFMDKLFETGADDVFITPVIMKKSRNASKLSVLCKQSVSNRISDILLRETSTFGIRQYSVEKTALERDFIEIETAYGKVRIKRAFLNDEMIKQKPEYDDCVRISKKFNISINEVYKEIDKILYK